jgi:hypothetical protein
MNMISGESQQSWQGTMEDLEGNILPNGEFKHHNFQNLRSLTPLKRPLSTSSTLPNNELPKPNCHFRP